MPTGARALNFMSREARPHTTVRFAWRRAIYADFGKRLADLVLVSLLAPLALPLIVLACLLVWRDGGAPIYGQLRVGRNGEVFCCWKIRTMVPEAERALDDLLCRDPALAQEWAETQKLAHAPRVTRIGRWLRRLSIDELPQLWNVALGQMSLIGPRPFMPSQRVLYDAQPGAAGYYRLRPGISGLWQVEARNGGSFRDRVCFDDAYARNLSPWLDLAIFLKTLVVLARASGR